MTNPAPQDWCIQNGACRPGHGFLRQRRALLFPMKWHRKLRRHLSQSVSVRIHIQYHSGHRRPARLSPPLAAGHR